MALAGVDLLLKRVADEARANSPSTDVEDLVAENAMAIDRENIMSTIAVTRRIREKLARERSTASAE
jgi:hypothetical protein